MNLNLVTIAGLLALGVIAGVLSSMVGVGGGIVIVPALVFFFAMSQKMAQGTSLAMLLPPIGILAVMNYYKSGYIDVKVSVILIVSFIIGSYFGSRWALSLPEAALKKIFGGILLLVAVKYLFFSK